MTPESTEFDFAVSGVSIRLACSIEMRSPPSDPDHSLRTRRHLASSPPPARMLLTVLIDSPLIP